MDSRTTFVEAGEDDFSPAAPAKFSRTIPEPRKPGARDARIKSQKPIDALLYLGAICGVLQATYPDFAPMGWIVEGKGAGALSEAVCRIIGILVCEIVAEAGGSTYSAEEELPLKIVLRRRGQILLCAISGSSLSETRAPALGLRRAQEIAARLGRSCLLRSVPERGLMAILLDVDEAESRIPGAIAAYRKERSARSAFV